MNTFLPGAPAGSDTETPGALCPEAEVTRARLLAGANAFYDALTARLESWPDNRLHQLNPSLRSGLALLLIYYCDAWQVRQQERSARMAHRLARVLADRFLTGQLAGYSLLEGNGGAVYALSHYLQRFPAEPFSPRPLVDKVLRDQPVLLSEQTGNDLGNGRAGILTALLSLYQAIGDRRLLRLVGRVFLRLVGDAKVRGRGICWGPYDSCVRPVIGLLHGSAGIASSLAVLSSELGGSAIPFLIRSSGRYAASERKNHPDWPGNYRGEPGKERYPPSGGLGSLTEGLAGLLLVKLRLYAWGDRKTPGKGLRSILNQIDVYLRETAQAAGTDFGEGPAGLLWALALANRRFPGSLTAQPLNRCLRLLGGRVPTPALPPEGEIDLMEGLIGLHYAVTAAFANPPLAEQTALAGLFGGPPPRRRSGARPAYARGPAAKRILRANFPNLFDYYPPAAMKQLLDRFAGATREVDQYAFLRQLRAESRTGSDRLLPRILHLHLIMARHKDRCTNYREAREDSRRGYAACKKYLTYPDQALLAEKFTLNPRVLLHVSGLPCNQINKLYFEPEVLQAYLSGLREAGFTQCVSAFKVSVLEKEVICESEDFVSPVQIMILHFFNAGPGTVEACREVLMRHRRNLPLRALREYVLLLVRQGILVPVAG